MSAGLICKGRDLMSAGLICKGRALISARLICKGRALMENSIAVEDCWCLVTALGLCHFYVDTSHT